MKENKTCQKYGTRSQGVCVLDFEGGICRSCSGSISAFGNTQEISGKNSGGGNGANFISCKIKSALFFFTNGLKKRTQLLICRLNNRRHKKTPFYKHINKNMRLSTAKGE